MKSQPMCSNSIVKVEAKVRVYLEYQYNSEQAADDSVLEEMYRDADRVSLDIMAHEFSKNLCINYYPEERRYELTMKDKT